MCDMNACICHSGQLCVDGGLTNSLPVLPTGRTVTFSPFSGRADVSPRDLGWPGIYVRVAKQDVMVSHGVLVGCSVHGSGTVSVTHVCMPHRMSYKHYVCFIIYVLCV